MCSPLAERRAIQLRHPNREGERIPKGKRGRRPPSLSLWSQREAQVVGMEWQKRDEA